MGPRVSVLTGTSSWCPHKRESVIAGNYLSQTSVIYFCRELAAVGIIGVSVITWCPQGES